MKVRWIISLTACGFLTAAGLNANFSSRLPNAQAANTLPSTQQNGGAAALKEGRELLRRGQSDQALSRLQTAVKLFTQDNNLQGAAAANDALGDLYLRQGQPKVAAKYYREAQQAFGQARSGQSGVETALGVSDNEYNANLMLAKVGAAEQQAGDSGASGSAYNEMQVQKPDPSKVAGGIANTPNNVKNTGSGIMGGLRGGLGGLKRGNVPTTPPVTGVEGVGSALGAVRASLELYRQSILYSQRELGLGRLAFDSNNYSSAAQHYNDALAVASLPIVSKFGQSRRVRAAARVSLGDVALKQNKPKDAIKFYSDAAKGANEDKRIDLLWSAQRGVARAKWLSATQEKDAKKGLKARDEALASYREAIGTVETIRAGSLRSDEARTTFLTTIEDVYDEAATASADTALLAANGNGASLTGLAAQYAEESFKYSEMGRARSLLDLLGENGLNINADVAPELMQRKRDNLARQQAIAEELTGIALTQDEKNQPSTSKLEDELETLVTEYDQIENEIRTRSPRYASLTANHPLTLSETQRRVLDDKTVALEYLLGDDNSYLFAVASNSVSLYKLPARDQVNKLAQDLRAQIIPPKLQRRIVGIDVAENTRGLGLATAPYNEAAAGFAAAANGLYQVAVAPAAASLADKRLLIIADGALNYIPFEALVTAPGGSEFAALPYLIQKNEIVYAPSASVLAALRAEGQNANATGGVLVVADPVFYGKDPRARGAAATASAGNEARGLGLATAVTDVTTAQPETLNIGTTAGLPLARLAGTRAEATQISTLAKQSGGTADVWLDFDATENNLQTKDLTKYRVLHIATHGLLNAEHPQFTGVVLSLVGNKTGDGFLRTEEVFNLKLNHPLVMLSACETGLGREKRGEGVIGLTRAFMYAGAPTVGVSLWSVADTSTAQLMSDFYKNYLIKKGTPPPTAMRQAQLTMIAGKKYAAPFYWSPFVINGDWR